MGRVSGGKAQAKPFLLGKEAGKREMGGEGQGGRVLEHGWGGEKPGALPPEGLQCLRLSRGPHGAHPQAP